MATSHPDHPQGPVRYHPPGIRLQQESEGTRMQSMAEWSLHLHGAQSQCGTATMPHNSWDCLPGPLP